MRFSKDFYENKYYLGSLMYMQEEDSDDKNGSCKLSKSFVSDIDQMIRKVHALVDNYILRADTNIYDCNGQNDFIYEATYNFKDLKQKEKYFKENRDEELKCLTNYYMPI